MMMAIFAKIVQKAKTFDIITIIIGLDKIKNYLEEPCQEYWSLEKTPMTSY